MTIRPTSWIFERRASKHVAFNFAKYKLHKASSKSANKNEYIELNSNPSGYDSSPRANQAAIRFRLHEPLDGLKNRKLRGEKTSKKHQRKNLRKLLLSFSVLTYGTSAVDKLAVPCCWSEHPRERASASVQHERGEARAAERRERQLVPGLRGRFLRQSLHVRTLCRIRFQNCMFRKQNRILYKKCVSGTEQLAA